MLKVSSGLEFCGPDCWSNAVLGAVTDVFDFGEDVFDTALNLPGYARDTVNLIKHGVFDGWAQWTKLNGLIGKQIVNGFNAAYDGVVEFAAEAWDAMIVACRYFREYKEYINIGIQVVQGDYVNAGANLAEVAAEAMGLPPVIQGTDSQVVALGEFVCAAIDGIRAVSAIANGMPLPPPLTPSDVLVTRASSKIAVAERFRLQFQTQAPNSGRVLAPPSPAQQAAASKPRSILTPTVVVGASAAAALLILSR